MNIIVCVSTFVSNMNTFKGNHSNFHFNNVRSLHAHCTNTRFSTALSVILMQLTTKVPYEIKNVTVTPGL